MVTAKEVEGFMRDLPVAKLWGVGKKMQEKLTRHGVITCGDMQKLDKIAMSRRYGRWGVELYELCRGTDAREVEVHRMRKSISKETTFSEDVVGALTLVPELRRLVDEVEQSYQSRYTERDIKSVVVKLKFADFTRTTIEKASTKVDVTLAEALLIDGYARGGGKAVRLLGVGIRLADEEDETQLEMF